jgi:hypothetical protein
MNESQRKLISVCTKEFFTHPNWNSCLDLFRYYIEDLHSVDSIDTTGKTNDEIATELRARQIVKERIERFIDDTLTIQKIKQGVPTKTRKYR